MWDQKVASITVNDWKQCIFSGIHCWNMWSSHAAGDFQPRSYSPQSLLSSVPGLFQAVVGLGKKSPASGLGKVGRYIHQVYMRLGLLVMSTWRVEHQWDLCLSYLTGFTRHGTVCWTNISLGTSIALLPSCLLHNFVHKVLFPEDLSKCTHQTMKISSKKDPSVTGPPPPPPPAYGYLHVL